MDSVTYTPIDFKTFSSDPEQYILPLSPVWMAKNGKNKRAYVRLYMGFDIETYTTPEHYGYMYLWQFSIYGEENYIIYGRQWSEFVQLIDILKRVLNLSPEKRIIIFDFNLGYEFQYLKRWFKWSKIFAREVRKPIYAFIDDCIEFRDAQSITGGSLALLAKQYCTTQKKVGQLDYTKERTWKTKLDANELDYSFSDVAILAEFSEYIFNTYIIPEKYIPLTKTGLLRREVKKAIGKNFDIKREIYRCYPSDYNLYTTLMQWCFRGGYCHANLWHVGTKVNGIHSRDITSSYPFEMLAGDGYPNSPLVRRDTKDFEKCMNDNLCCMFRAIFINLRATTNHSYESKSKCLTIPKSAIIDNGRIRRVDGIVDVWLTDVDYWIYKRFYEWDDMIVQYLYTAIKGKLPNYVKRPLADVYVQKSIMKKEGLSNSPEYANYKSLVNSGYG